MVNIQEGTFSGGHSTSAGGHGPKMPPLGYGPERGSNLIGVKKFIAYFIANISNLFVNIDIISFVNLVSSFNVT